ELRGYELLSQAARKRGFMISGGEFDTLRMANIALDEFRAGTIGRITLEKAG
ncbi:MAG: ribosome biogenesis GTPase YlqF, partial [Oscillospiraceae bacterium]|nr:ribosome biogenesis GTPase YlqF [Oscillospiraceae bacterium]